MSISSFTYATTSENAITAMDAWNSTYNSGISPFGGWPGAVCVEMLADAYELTGSASYKQKVIDGLQSSININETDFLNPDWCTDDPMWLALAAIRAYQVTGNNDYLAWGENCTNGIYSRGWDTSYFGGGIWWIPGEQDEKDSGPCNGQVARAYCMLYQINGNSTYLSRAEAIYAWIRSTLMNTSTGQINDCIERNGNIRTNQYTYNYGEVIAAANLLYQITGDTTYYDDAVRSLSYVQNHLCNSNGILQSETENGENDYGFKGIFVRDACKFLKDNNISTFTAWLNNNANTAWANRNGANLMDQNWAEKTSMTPDSWSASAAVTLLLDVIGLPDGGTAYYKIQNRWLGSYLYDDGSGKVKYGTGSDDTYLWSKESNDGYIRFKNKSTGKYMHIENSYGYVETGAIQSDCWSADWSPVANGNYTRLQNRWQTNQFMNVENQTGYVESASAAADCWGADWTLIQQ